MPHNPNKLHPSLENSTIVIATANTKSVDTYLRIFPNNLVKQVNPEMLGDKRVFEPDAEVMCLAPDLAALVAATYKLGQMARYFPKEAGENVIALVTDVVYASGDHNPRSKPSRRGELSQAQLNLIMEETIFQLCTPSQEDGSVNFQWWMANGLIQLGQNISDARVATSTLNVTAHLPQPLHPDEVRKKFDPQIPTAYPLIEAAKTKGAQVTVTYADGKQEKSSSLGERLIKNKVLTLPIINYLAETAQLVGEYTLAAAMNWGHLRVGRDELPR